MANSIPVLSGIGNGVNQVVNPNSQLNDFVGGALKSLISPLDPSGISTGLSNLFGSNNTSNSTPTNTGKIAGPSVPQTTSSQPSLLDSFSNAFNAQNANTNNLMKQLESSATGAPDYNKIYDSVFNKIQTSQEPYFQLLGNIYQGLQNYGVTGQKNIQNASDQTLSNLKGDINTTKGIYDPQIADAKAQGANAQQKYTDQTNQLIEGLQRQAKDSALMQAATSKLGGGGANYDVTASENAAQAPYARAELNANTNLEDNINQVVTNTQSAVNQLTGQEGGQIQTIQDQINMLPFNTQNAEDQFVAQNFQAQTGVITQAMNINMSDLQQAGSQSLGIQGNEIAAQKASNDKISALLSSSENLSNQDLQQINNYIQNQMALTPKTTNTTTTGPGILGSGIGAPTTKSSNTTGYANNPILQGY